MEPCKILHATSRGLESVMDHQPQIVMGLNFCHFPSKFSPCLSGATAGRRFSLDHELLTRQRKVNANVTLLPFSVVAVRNLNGHAAARDSTVKGVELRGLLADPILHHRG
jgi:hypothetical protein